MPDITPAEQIAAALARLRGRRMPRPGPWAADPRPHAPGAAHGGSHADHSWTHGGAHHAHGAGHVGPPRFGGPARLRLLEALVAASVPLTVGEIADAVGVDQPRASRLVQQAVEAGLVRREADPNDARRTRVALTETGRTIVRGFRGERRDAIDSALGGFSAAERAELARLLTKLADAWPRG